MKSMKKGLIPDKHQTNAATTMSYCVLCRSLKCVRYWCGRFHLIWDNLCITGKNSGI